MAPPVRKVPFAVKDPLKQELERLVMTGILQPVDVPTNWISSMVVVKKSNGKIRLCIDRKPLNAALKRNHYPLPVIDDLLPLLVKFKVFSVVDARNGFWHVQLDNESSFFKRFLGMVKYLQKFAPNLSEVTAPMRDLLKQRNEFHWDKEVQGQTFKQV